MLPLLEPLLYTLTSSEYPSFVRLFAVAHVSSESYCSGGAGGGSSSSRSRRRGSKRSSSDSRSGWRSFGISLRRRSRSWPRRRPMSPHLTGPFPKSKDPHAPASMNFSSWALQCLEGSSSPIGFEVLALFWSFLRLDRAFGIQMSELKSFAFEGGSG